MSKIYSLKVLKNGQLMTRKMVLAGQGKGAKALILTANSDQAYVLNTDFGNAPVDKITTKQVGKNLHIALEGESIDSPNVIIENYFDFESSSVVATTSGTGALMPFAPSTNFLTSATSSEAAVTQVSSGASYTTTQMALAGTALFALASARNQSDSAATPSGTTPTETILAYAKASTATAVTAPKTADYTAAGVTGVTDANLAAINQGVQASHADTIPNLQKAVDAYVKVLGLADSVKANTTDATKIPTLADYTSIGALKNFNATTGATGGTASALAAGTGAQKDAALKLLNEAIDSRSNAQVDTIAEINLLSIAADKVMAVSTAATTAAGTAVGLTNAELTSIGVQGVTTDNLAAITEAIRQAAVATTDGSKVDTLAELQKIVDSAIIIAYADAAVGTSVPTTAPTVAQYTSVGLLAADSLPNLAVTNSNVTALNSAVAALTGPDVNTVDKIQTIVNSYGKVLAMADGTKANTTDTTKTPALSDYTNLGALKTFDATTGVPLGTGGTNALASGTGTQSAAALKLLNDVVDGRTNAQVDSIAEINLLSIAADKIMKLSVAADTSAATALGLTTLDFSSLGVSGVTNDNLATVTEVIRQVPLADGSEVDTLPELQALVSLSVAQLYAGDGAKTAPSLTNYQDLNISGVNWNTTLQGAVNSVVNALNAAEITNAKLTTISLSYQSILNEASNAIFNTNTDPSAAQYESVLLSPSHLFHGALNSTDTTSKASNALSLLNEVVQHKSPGNVDSINELETLATSVDHLIASATAGSSNITIADLLNMGFVDSSFRSSQLIAFRNLIAATDDNGSAINTWNQVQNTLANPAVINA